jgi:4-amino-4-deoxy-L-arabinose transferase-like glycosyltransferase
MAKRYFNAKTALFSSLIFLGLPSVIMHSTSAYSDFGLVFYVLLSIYALLNWQRENNVFWLVSSGIFCGLSIGAKYTGAINLLLLTLFIIIRQKKIKPLIYFLAPCLVIVLPWLAKNMIFVNNPVYPFLYNIFGGKYWNAFNMERYYRILGSYGPKNLSSMPWYLIGEWKTDIPLGPILFIILPFTLILKKIDNKIKYFLLYAILYFMIWAMTAPVIRFYLPPAALGCVICGYTIERYERKSKILYNLSIFLAISLLFYYLWFVGTGLAEATPIIKQEVEEYFQGVEYINRNLPPRSKILLVGEARTFGVEKEAITSSIFDTAIMAEIVKSSKNTSEIKRELKQKDISHLLLNEVRLDWSKAKFDYFNWQNRSQEVLFERFIKSPHLKLVKKINRILIFKIVPE